MRYGSKFAKFEIQIMYWNGVKSKIIMYSFIRVIILYRYYNFKFCWMQSNHSKSFENTSLSSKYIYIYIRGFAKRSSLIFTYCNANLYVSQWVRLVRNDIRRTKTKEPMCGLLVLLSGNFFTSLLYLPSLSIVVWCNDNASSHTGVTSIV